MLDANLEKNITDLLIEYRGIQFSIKNTEDSINEINQKIAELECERNTLRNCKPIIDDIIDKFSESLLKKLEELLTIGLKKIFFDRNYSIQIKVIEKRNAKCVELLLNDDGNLIPIKSSNVAGGVLVVIASIIQIFYIMNLDISKCLFLDEQFTAISKLYVPNFMEFIKTLCQETGLMVILVTHDEKFMRYGNRTYFVDKGKFTLQENKLEEDD